MHLAYVHHFPIGTSEKGPRITHEMNWSLAGKEILKEFLMFKWQGKGWVVRGYESTIKLK